MALTIAYLGPEKTNTHVAAQAKFSRRGEYIHAPTVEDVFHLVERRQANYGVVPIENSLEGAVTHTLDRFIDFIDTPVKIHGETEQPIHHYLLIHQGMTLTLVRTVYSRPQALAQCHRWLAQHLPYAERRETYSTTEAVYHLLRDKDTKAQAAIARKELGVEHQLQTLPITQDRDNKTRFLILGLGEPKKGKRNKTSILLTLKDKPGALHDALMPFKRQGINLTKIESRPSKKKAWEYLFFIDFEGHESEPRVQRALKSLQRSTSLLRVLGSYPITR